MEARDFLVRFSRDDSEVVLVYFLLLVVRKEESVAHSYVAFIDEAGDQGFNFKPFPDRASSEWFVLSALVVKASEAHRVLLFWKELTKSIEAGKRQIHFTKLNHEERVAIIHKLAKSPHCTAISICINKAGLTMPHTLSMKGERRLYFWTSRLLLERISWYVRDSRSWGAPRIPAKLVFSSCKNLKYAKLKDYLMRLKTTVDGVNIAWDFLDCDKIQIRNHRELLGLRMADVVASGIAAGLELSPYGFCESRFAKTLKPIVYKRTLSYTKYGLKFIPSIPAVVTAMDNRYKWIDRYK